MLEVDEPIDIVASSEGVRGAVLVLRHPARKVPGHADIEPPRTAGHDVHEVVARQSVLFVRRGNADPSAAAGDSFRGRVIEAAVSG